jgi:hypothetical protein
MEAIRDLIEKVCSEQAIQKEEATRGLILMGDSGIEALVQDISKSFLNGHYQRLAHLATALGEIITDLKYTELSGAGSIQSASKVLKSIQESLGKKEFCLLSQAEELTLAEVNYCIKELENKKVLTVKG